MPCTSPQVQLLGIQLGKRLCGFESGVMTPQGKRFVSNGAIQPQWWIPECKRCMRVIQQHDGDKNASGAIDSLKNVLDDMGNNSTRGLPCGIPGNLPNPFGGNNKNDKDKKDGGSKNPFGGLFGKK